MATKPSDDYSWTEPESQANDETLPKYPYCHATITESGHSFELDDTPGRERIRLQHGGAQTDGDGTFFEIQSDGTRINKIVGDNYEIVAKDNNVIISGVCNITIEGNSVVHVKGDKYEKIDGDYYLEVGGKLSQTVADTSSLGIVLGGSGNGEQIAANKVKGVRAVLAWSVETAKLGRDHNNANVVGIGGRMHSIEDCKAIIDAFIETPFSNDERHVRRINKIAKYENEGSL